MTAEGPEEQPPTPTPVVPPDLRLRGERPRVTRLSRRVLIGLGAVSALAVAGALGYALQTRNAAQSGQELLSTQNRPSAEGLAGLPKDYTGLPRQAPPLGPPLPGDLGKPILNAGAAPNTVAPATTPDPEAQRRARDRGGAAQPPLCPDQSAAPARRARRAGWDRDDDGSDPAPPVDAGAAQTCRTARRPSSMRRRTSARSVQTGSTRRPRLMSCRPALYSRRAHHGHSFRFAWSDHCPGDGGGL